MKNKRSNTLKKLVAVVVFFAICFALGILLGKVMVSILPEDGSSEERLWNLFMMLLGLYVGMFLHIVIHEAGHLVCGLISGYTFVSFRIGGLMLFKRDGKYRFARYSLAGTAGQCLLSPPELKDGKIPVTLYNLGGVLFNLLFSFVFALLILVFPPYLDSFCLSFVAVGGITALTNGIPMKTGTVNNDGSNAFHLLKDADACRAFWLQLKINALQMQGTRLADMPAEWFERPAPEQWKNSMLATLWVLRCNWLSDQGLWERADAEMKELLNADSAIIGIHRQLLTLERCFCALLRGSDPDGVLKEWNSRSLQKLQRAMKRFPMILRVQYAYALLHEQNETLAEQKRAELEKALASYPFAGELAGERQWLPIIAERAKNRSMS
ncbi:MAG: hypothetical protein J6B71_02200 [Clostridia bacterium]|nr:hypothetical protein [Clostridia bacterium]